MKMPQNHRTDEEVVEEGSLPQDDDIIFENTTAKSHMGTRKFLEQIQGQAKKTLNPRELQANVTSIIENLQHRKRKFWKLSQEKDCWVELTFTQIINATFEVILGLNPISCISNPRSTPPPLIESSSISTSRNDDPIDDDSKKGLRAEYSLKRCRPMKKPYPIHYAGDDVEQMKACRLPEMSVIANFPTAPRGICVMCGLERPMKKTSSNCPIIPAQNKNVCTACDVQVWIFDRRNAELQIKWCKGCKNFRTWATFGLKGKGTKCLPCREYQAELYAQKKKKKAMMSSSSSTASARSGSVEVKSQKSKDSLTADTPGSSPMSERSKRTRTLATSTTAVSSPSKKMKVEEDVQSTSGSAISMKRAKSPRGNVEVMADSVRSGVISFSSAADVDLNKNNARRKKKANEDEKEDSPMIDDSRQSNDSSASSVSGDQSDNNSSSNNNNNSNNCVRGLKQRIITLELEWFGKLNALKTPRQRIEQLEQEIGIPTQSTLPLQTRMFRLESELGVKLV